MNNNTKEELDARRKEFVIQQKKLMIKFILFLLVVISVILMYQLLSYNKESKKQEIKSLDQQSQEINQEIGELAVSSEITNKSTKNKIASIAGK